mmetsp:Transcript_36542/g.54669  ORF Transcript_36542/g.54669 Transcript_36542/m.54669 type:complete len:271 (-) Transcript_36542:238-1050(-)
MAAAEMSDLEKEIMDYSMRGVLPPRGRAPIALIMWGGIGAGKTTASPALLAKLGMDRAQTVVIDVDELVQKVPEFQQAKGTEQQKAAYMKYRNDAKKIQKQVALTVLQKGLDVYVEWTNEGNLHALGKGESDVFQQAALVAKKYTVAVCLVECRDVEGILAAVKEREKEDGRHIPEGVIREFNTDRALHWFNALLQLEKRPLQTRAFVQTRKCARSCGVGLMELTGGVRPLVASCDGGEADAAFPDEAAAQAAIDRLRQRMEEASCCWCS